MDICKRSLTWQAQIDNKKLEDVQDKKCTPILISRYNIYDIYSGFLNLNKLNVLAENQAI